MRYHDYTLDDCSVLYTVVPVYIAEIAPKKLRGRLISFNSFGLTSGILVHTTLFIFFHATNMKKISTEISNLA